jgi:hypothetical protein
MNRPVIIQAGRGSKISGSLEYLFRTLPRNSKDPFAKTVAYWRGDDTEPLRLQERETTVRGPTGRFWALTNRTFHNVFPTIAYTKRIGLEVIF